MSHETAGVPGTKSWTATTVINTVVLRDLMRKHKKGTAVAKAGFVLRCVSCPAVPSQHPTAVLTRGKIGLFTYELQIIFAAFEIARLEPNQKGRRFWHVYTWLALSNRTGAARCSFVCVPSLEDNPQDIIRMSRRHQIHIYILWPVISGAIFALGYSFGIRFDTTSWKTTTDRKNFITTGTAVLP